MADENWMDAMVDGNNKDIRSLQQYKSKPLFTINFILVYIANAENTRIKKENCLPLAAKSNGVATDQRIYVIHFFLY